MARKYLERIDHDDPDYYRIIASLNREQCPDCAGAGLIAGLRRSLTREMFCRPCGSGFAVSPYHFGNPPHQFHSVRRISGP
jgi:hypothetical protein